MKLPPPRHFIKIKGQVLLDQGNYLSSLRKLYGGHGMFIFDITKIINICLSQYNVIKENLLLLDEMIYLSYYFIKLIKNFILNHNYDKKYLKM